MTDTTPTASLDSETMRLRASICEIVEARDEEDFDRLMAAINDAASEAVISAQRKADDTLPRPAAECPSCHGLNTSCPEGCGRDKNGQLDGSTLSPDTQDSTDGGIALQFAVAYIDGYAEDEPEDFLRNWRKVKAAALSPSPAQPVQEPVAVTLIEAFDMGRAWEARMTRPQVHEDSRAVGRELGGAEFSKIAGALADAEKELGFDPFAPSEAGRCQAIKLFHRALASPPTDDRVLVQEVADAADHMIRILNEGVTTPDIYNNAGKRLQDIRDKIDAIQSCLSQGDEK